MRAFSCDHCHSPVVFENTLCATCGSPVAYDRRQRTMVVETLAPLGLRYTDADGRVSVPCANLDLANCNWLAEVDAIDGLCSSCLLTRTRPANDDPIGLLAFVAAETAKRRLLFQLDELGLPSTPRFRRPDGLAFDFLSSHHGAVAAGHQNGLITIDLSERADDEPGLAPPPLDEAARTLLGVLRHEIGHWYFTVLIAGTSWLERLPPSASAVAPGSALASDGPGAEVFADAFARYLELRDAVQTAASFELHVGSAPGSGTPLGDAGSPVNFDQLIAVWLPLTSALNAVSRSRGESDPYPSTYSEADLARLRFVHDRISVR